MAADLAKELGLSESKVKPALEDAFERRHQQLVAHARFAPAESRRRGGVPMRSSPGLAPSRMGPRALAGSLGADKPRARRWQ